MKACLLTGALCALTACADHIAAPAARPTPAPVGIASLVASDSAPAPGGVVTFTARLIAGAAATKRAGAYAAHVEYDPSIITYVGEGENTSGLVSFHANAGVLRVAGASIDGYAGGVLFRARFRVTRRSPQAELRLVIDELRDAGPDATRTVAVADRLPEQLSTRTALLRPWP